MREATALGENFMFASNVEFENKMLFL